jgi:ABC-type bacteriocin/lantibiotic exporter with double-glycine peptidase domain
MKSKLPFHRQETASSCAVACLRILLEVHGVKVTEAELREKCKTTELGTYAKGLMACARDFGFEASLEYLTVDQLKSLVDGGIYPIAYINMFPTSYIPYTHAVIIESLEGDQFLMIDPLDGPKEIKLSNFLEGWEVFGNMAIVIRRG